MEGALHDILNCDYIGYDDNFMLKSMVVNGLYRYQWQANIISKFNLNTLIWFHIIY